MEGVWLSALDCLYSLKLALGSSFPASSWTTHLLRQWRPAASCPQHPPSHHLAMITTPASLQSLLRPASRSSAEPSLLTQDKVDLIL